MSNHHHIAESARLSLRGGRLAQGAFMDVKKSNRGFASLSPERRIEVARMGGSATPGDKRAFARNPELARAAGKKGGEASAVKTRKVYV